MNHIKFTNYFCILTTQPSITLQYSTKSSTDILDLKNSFHNLSNCFYAVGAHPKSYNISYMLHITSSLTFSVSNYVFMDVSCYRMMPLSC